MNRAVTRLHFAKTQLTITLYACILLRYISSLTAEQRFQHDQTNSLDDFIAYTKSVINVSKGVELHESDNLCRIITMFEDLFLAFYLLITIRVFYRDLVFTINFFTDSRFAVADICSFCRGDAASSSRCSCTICSNCKNVSWEDPCDICMLRTRCERCHRFLPDRMNTYRRRHICMETCRSSLNIENYVRSCI